MPRVKPLAVSARKQIGEAARLRALTHGQWLAIAEGAKPAATTGSEGGSE